VHFANENLDLYSRGGRLSADIQAVVAADYIRNLREEVKKGIYGRLKQGLFPMPAPVGYMNMGAGKPKAIDSVMGPLVKQAFEFYATGGFSLKSLAGKMRGLGLKSRNGKEITDGALAHLLHNLFYTGVIHMRRTREYYTGQHQPIISQGLYGQVQELLRRTLVKTPSTGSLKEAFLFRRMVFCASCDHRFVAERHKGHVYYRCQVAACPQKCIRKK
jgi:site-specific DNA recombinase